MCFLFRASLSFGLSGLSLRVDAILLTALNKACQKETCSTDSQTIFRLTTRHCFQISALLFLPARQASPFATLHPPETSTWHRQASKQTTVLHKANLSCSLNQQRLQLRDPCHCVPCAPRQLGWLHLSSSFSQRNYSRQPLCI